MLHGITVSGLVGSTKALGHGPVIGHVWDSSSGLLVGWRLGLSNNSLGAAETRGVMSGVMLVVVVESSSTCTGCSGAEGGVAAIVVLVVMRVVGVGVGSHVGWSVVDWASGVGVRGSGRVAGELRIMADGVLLVRVVFAELMGTITGSADTAYSGSITAVMVVVGVRIIMSLVLVAARDESILDLLASRWLLVAILIVAIVVMGRRVAVRRVTTGEITRGGVAVWRVAAGVVIMVMLSSFVDASASSASTTNNGGIATVVVLWVRWRTRAQRAIVVLVGIVGSRGAVVIVAWESILDLLTHGWLLIVGIGAVVVDIAIMDASVVSASVVDTGIVSVGVVNARVVITVVLVSLVSSKTSGTSSTDNSGITAIVVLVVRVHITAHSVASSSVRRVHIGWAGAPVAGVGVVIGATRNDGVLDLLASRWLLVAVLIIAIAIAALAVVIAVLVELMGTEAGSANAANDTCITSVVVLVVLVSRTKWGIIIDIGADSLAAGHWDSGRVLEVLMGASLQTRRVGVVAVQDTASAASGNIITLSLCGCHVALAHRSVWVDRCVGMKLVTGVVVSVSMLVMSEAGSSSTSTKGAGTYSCAWNMAAGVSVVGVVASTGNI